MGVTATKHDLVPNEPLRKALAQRGLSAHDVGRLLKPELHWKQRCWYGTRIRRVLGLSPWIQAYTGRRYYQSRIGYDLAVEIAQAADIDPVEVGL
jgi:hypothetical protein